MSRSDAGTLLRRFAQRASLPQRELAQLVHVHPLTISRLMKGVGKTKVLHDVVEQIDDRSGLSAEELRILAAQWLFQDLMETKEPMPNVVAVVMPYVHRNHFFGV